jgi:1-deoxy-D-xylulose-5-phosphate reductoisomerase
MSGVTDTERRDTERRDTEQGDDAAPRTLIILGSTGSIGTQALDVIRRNPGRFLVAGLAAGGGRIDLLADQILDLLAAGHPLEAVAVADPAAAGELPRVIAARAASRDSDSGSGVPGLPKLLVGPDAATELAAWPADAVLNGVDGAIGLAPTLAALRAGHRLILANKESLIIGGPLVRDLAAPGQITPVDSEHSALAQCLRAGRAGEVRRLLVTASGGPFRGRARAELADVTPEQALAHPTWSMGPLVTINSATLVNKGLEIIEAHLLFDVPFERIDVVVHPQSIVHSMVEFADGSTIAQASPPDMRLPIALGLGWPRRVADAAPACDWSAAARWEFYPLDHDAFPAVGLAKRVGAAGGVAPAVYNGANEACVAAFLDRRMPFTGIVDTIARVVAEHEAGQGPHGHPAPGGHLTLEEVLAADAWARRRAAELAGVG